MPGHILVKDYLGPDTFDVAAKTMFARMFLSQGHHGTGGWPYSVYLEHLRVWNGFSEGEKHAPWDFDIAFCNLLQDMRDGRFDWNRSPIPTRNGKLTNGRHRLAAALVLDRHIRTVEAEEPCDCSAEHLRQLGLNSWMLDSMAIEYCRLKTEARIVVVYGPHDRGHIIGALADAGRVFYEKTVTLEDQGPINLVHELYLGEQWLPEHGQLKADGCFPRGRGLVTFYGLEVLHQSELLTCKRNLRQDLGRGQDSLHINDIHEETMRLAQALFNDNGIHFLNHAHPRRYPHAHVRAHAHGVSIDSGGVLEVYGLRRASDIDFVDEDLHLEFHGVPLPTLLDDPRNFFWTAGVKFASISAVRRMKTNRGEAKDKRDLALMEGL